MHCLGCDYPLDGLPSGTCPECRRSFDPADERTHQPFPGRGWRRRQFVWVVPLLAVLATELVICFRAHEDTLFVFLLVTGLSGGIAMVAGILLRRSKPDARVALLMTAPALLWLFLLVSLAAHMHASLGGWPRTIGNAGFSRMLEAHADLTMLVFTGLFLSGLLAWLLLPVFACWRRGRQWIYHLGILVLTGSLGLGLLLLAPTAFTDWWWD